MNKVKSGAPLNTIVLFPLLPYESYGVKMFYVKPMDFKIKQEKANLLILFFSWPKPNVFSQMDFDVFDILMFLVITNFA